MNGADQLQLIKEATALKYGGDALGGVLQIIPKQPIKDSLMGALTTGYTPKEKAVTSADVTKTSLNGNYLALHFLKKCRVATQTMPCPTPETENNTQLFYGRNTITQE